MSDPIKVWDKQGKEHTFFAPAWVEEQVKAGIYSYDPPAEGHVRREQMWLDRMDFEQLKATAASRGIKGWHKFTKEESLKDAILADMADDIGDKYDFLV